MIKKLSQSCLFGLSILLPVLLSLQLLIWIFNNVEQWLESIWLLVLPDQLYFTGLGLISFLLLATMIGFSSRFRMIKWLWSLPGNLLQKIPVVSYVYDTIKDFLDLIGGKGFADNTVVWVKLPEADGKLLGIVTKTGEDKGSNLSKIIGEDEVAVFLPMSYQAGGYMVILPSSQVEKVDIAPGEAIRLIMSAGLGKKT